MLFDSLLVARPCRPMVLVMVLVCVLLGNTDVTLADANEAMTLAEVGERTATIDLESLERGQKGYGYSVFAGTEPQRFEVEVIGLVRKTTPELSYLLARLSGQDLERSGVIAGMSGSPVYFDGRLAGAVSFGYVFGLDPIAGITPIGAMRELAEDSSAGLNSLQLASPSSTGSVPTVGVRDLVERSFERERLAQALAILSPTESTGSSRAVWWTADGFGAAAQQLLQSTLGSVGVGGTASSFSGDTGLRLAESQGVDAGSAPRPEAVDLVPGSSVAAVLVSGDLRLAAHGTVTDRWDDHIVAFGHPVFSAGPINVPMAVSEVVTVIPNAANSFKVSNSGPVVGAFVQDREAGAYGKLGLVAPQTPVTIKLRGLTERDYAMQVVNMPQLRPALIAVSALGVVTAGSYVSEGLDLRATFDLGDDGELHLRQNFSGTQATVDCVLYLMSFAAYFELNDLKKTDLRAVEIELTQTAKPQVATLRSAFASRRVVEPGEIITLTLEQRAYRGEVSKSHVEVEIPSGIPDGPLMLFVGDGTSMDGLRLGLEMPAPVTFDQALHLLRSLHSRRQVQVFSVVPRAGLVAAGEVMPNLPGSVASIIVSGDQASLSPLSFAIAGRETFENESGLIGAVRVDLRVRRR